MKKIYFTIAAFLVPIAGHGIMAISGNEDARFFLHWSMLLATLIGSGLGIFKDDFFSKIKGGIKKWRREFLSSPAILKRILSLKT